jgi:exosome complex component RRP41
MNQFGEVTLCQMDGHLTSDEFSTAMNMAIEGCKKLHELQKQALVEKYARGVAPIAVEAPEGGETTNE